MLVVRKAYKKVHPHPVEARSVSVAVQQRGMTLIEILVTMVILAIGLLGLAGTMLDGLRNNQSAYLRTQASIHAYDMADRIRINRTQAIAGAYDGYTADADTSVSAPSCATSAIGCSPSQQVTLDQAEWAEQIQGDGGIVMLPGGVGTITRAGDIFTVTVSWQETQWDEDAGSKAVGTQQFSIDFRL